jgi:hypothetical protein
MHDHLDRVAALHEESTEWIHHNDTLAYDTERDMMKAMIEIDSRVKKKRREI